MASDEHAFHGGQFFSAIGEDFSHMARRSEVINADVLDAWYDPSPQVLDQIREHLPWLIKTSPPTHAEGLTKVISEVRGIPESQIFTSPGTSAAMFLALPRLVSSGDTVTLLDPCYGEYPHLLERVIGCRILRCELVDENNFRVDLDQFISLASQSKLAVLVNPNSPTGVHLPLSNVKKILESIPDSTALWIDETYIDFVGQHESAESLLAQFPNLIISKSLSKFYSLSGLRVGYLAGRAEFISELNRLSPPWNVGMLGQLAAILAMRDPEYYESCRMKTIELRESMRKELGQMKGVQVFPSDANFLLFRLEKPLAEALVLECQKAGLYLRNCDSLSERFRGHFVRTAVKGDEWMAASNFRLDAGEAPDQNTIMNFRSPFTHERIIEIIRAAWRNLNG